MTVTDTIIGIAIIFMTANGAYDGFFRTLVWPLSLIITYIVAWAFFSSSGNIFASVAVGIFLPFFIRWILHLFLSQLSTYTNRTALPLLVRLGGSLVNFCWTVIFCLITVTLLAFVPLSNFGLGDITNDVIHSKAFHLIRPIVAPPTTPKTIPLSKEQKEDPACPLCSKDEALASDPAIQALMSHPKMIAITNNPELISALESGDTAKILKDPAMQELLKDPNFILQAMKAYATVRTRSIE